MFFPNMGVLVVATAALRMYSKFQLKCKKIATFDLKNNPSKSSSMQLSCGFI